MVEYIYIGDRFTSSELKKKTCYSVRRADGKAIRGRNGNMLVEFTGIGKMIVVARLLRRVNVP